MLRVFAMHVRFRIGIKVGALPKKIGSAIHHHARVTQINMAG